MVNYLSGIYIEKRGVQLVFTLLKGFAIPVSSRKTTDVHARYANLPTQITGEDGIYTYPRGHSSLLYGLDTEFCEDSE